MPGSHASSREVHHHLAGAHGESLESLNLLYTRQQEEMQYPYPYAHHLPYSHGVPHFPPHMANDLYKHNMGHHMPIPLPLAAAHHAVMTGSYTAAPEDYQMKLDGHHAAGRVRKNQALYSEPHPPRSLVAEQAEDASDEANDYSGPLSPGKKKKKRLCRVRSCGKLDKGRGYCKAVSEVFCLPLRSLASL